MSLLDVLALLAVMAGLAAVPSASVALVVTLPATFRLDSGAVVGSLVIGTGA